MLQRMRNVPAFAPSGKTHHTQHECPAVDTLWLAAFACSEFCCDRLLTPLVLLYLESQSQTTFPYHDEDDCHNDGEAREAGLDPEFGRDNMRPAQGEA